jgi:hypothetical protein
MPWVETVSGRIGTIINREGKETLVFKPLYAPDEQIRRASSVTILEQLPFNPGKINVIE